MTNLVATITTGGTSNVDRVVVTDKNWLGVALASQVASRLRGIAVVVVIARRLAPCRQRRKILIVVVPVVGRLLLVGSISL